MKVIRGQTTLRMSCGVLRRAQKEHATWFGHSTGLSFRRFLRQRYVCAAGRPAIGVQLVHTHRRVSKRRKRFFVAAASTDTGSNRNTRTFCGHQFSLPACTHHLARFAIGGAEGIPLGVQPRCRTCDSSGDGRSLCGCGR